MSRVARAVCVRRLHELAVAQAADPDIIHPAPPGRPTREGLSFGEIDDGDVDITDVKAGRHHRNDTWDLSIYAWCQAPGIDDSWEARARAEELIGICEDIIADDPKLGGIPGLMWAEASSLTGPTPVATDQGWWAFCELTVRFHCRLT